MKKIFYVAILVLASTTIGACSDDDDNTPATPSSTVGDVLMSVQIANPDGYTGSAYMQVIDGITPATYTNTQALPCWFGLPPYIYGSNVYVMPSTSSDVVVRYTVENGVLVKKWQITVPGGVNATNILEDGNKAYMVFVETATIRVINSETGETIKDIDLSSIAYNDNNPDPAAIAVRGNELFVALEQASMNHIFPYQDYKTVEVAIIDLTDYSIKNVAKQTTASMSNPTKNVNYNSIFVDENNDVYVTCNGSFGMYSDHLCGILRIKNGETEFDNDYVFDLTNTAIQNDGNTMRYFGHMAYFGNGILYAGVHVLAYETASGYNPLTDRTEMAVEIDLYNKTIKDIGLPRSNGYAAAIGLYNDNLIYGVASDTDNGFYTYNTKTGKASAESVIKPTGYPYIFRQLE